MLDNWIETHSGKKMYFLTPTQAMIDINDIAHSLSLQCRFSGHTSKFYSVAEHSCRVALWLEFNGSDRNTVLQGLLHDASEAYLLDVPSPVKQCLINYKDIEDGLMETIMGTFGVSWPLNPIVKEADAIMLKNEARQLLPSKGASWVDLYPTEYECPWTVGCWEPDEAKGSFLRWFDSLTKETENGARTQEAV